MTCRHSDGDSDCTSWPSKLNRARTLAESWDKDDPYKPTTPNDNRQFEIEDFFQQDRFLVLSVRYPSCEKCAFEGNKVMVFEGVTTQNVIFWTEIDPHFRDPEEAQRNLAPSPIARFPGNAVGWTDAVTFAKRKAGG